MENMEYGSGSEGNAKATAHQSVACSYVCVLFVAAHDKSVAAVATVSASTSTMPTRGRQGSSRSRHKLPPQTDNRGLDNRGNASVAEVNNPWRSCFCCNSLVGETRWQTVEAHLPGIGGELQLGLCNLLQLSLNAKGRMSNWISRDALQSRQGLWPKTNRW